MKIGECALIVRNLAEHMENEVGCKHQTHESKRTAADLSARFILNYKRLPYQTVWLSFPDIEAELQKLGVAPTTSPWWTLPS